MLPLYTLPLPSCILQSLNKLGYTTLSHITETTEEEKEKMRDCLKQFGVTVDDIIALTVPPTIVRADSLYKPDVVTESIPTFSESLDDILGGGIQLGTMYQVCGAPGSGKTQLVLQLCVDVQIPQVFGGLSGEAIFIDSESAFSLTRVQEIGNGTVKHCEQLAKIHSLQEDMKGFTKSSILEGIHYNRVMNHTQLLAAVHLIPSFIRTHPKVKVIVIDSITLPLLGIRKTVERTRIAYEILNKLHSLAVEHNLAVVFVNHMTTRISNGERTFAPSLGESLPHRSPHILLLGYIDGEFSAMMYKSPCLPKMNASFRITRDGIRDQIGGL